MLTMNDMESTLLWLAELRTKYPRFGIRWSEFPDTAYKMSCPGWCVLVAPRTWREKWEAIPEPRIPELSNVEFEGFYDEWSRHVGILSLTRSFLSDGPRD